MDTQLETHHSKGYENEWTTGVHKTSMDLTMLNEKSKLQCTQSITLNEI